MSKNNIIWLGLLSILGIYLIWVFHGVIFSSCYDAVIPTPPYVFIPNNPVANCVLYIALVAFASLFLGPILVTLAIYAIYVIIFNREMGFSHYILWFCWLVGLYFLYYEFTVLPRFFW